MKAEHYLRRTDLFLVRVWTGQGADSTGIATWSGQVQRVVDGELYPFDSPQALMSLMGDLLVIDRDVAPYTSGTESQSEDGASVAESNGN